MELTDFGSDKPTVQLYKRGYSVPFGLYQAETYGMYGPAEQTWMGYLCEVAEVTEQTLDAAIAQLPEGDYTAEKQAALEQAALLIAPFSLDYNILYLAKQAFPNGLWWIKDRANVNDHQLLDSVRGGDLALQCPTTDNEAAYVPPSGDSIAWCWKAGDSTANNNDGTIETQVSVNDTAGFSIITYTGNQTSGATIGHGLSQVPEFFMVKIRDGGSTNSWAVYHKDLGATRFLKLDTNDSQITNSNRWNDTAPTNQVITLGNDNSVNNNTNTFVCYAWHSVPNYSAIGLYPGNNSTNGPFIYTGFRPAFVLTKSTTHDGNWTIRDTTMAPHNPIDNFLRPNLTTEETINTNHEIDYLSNGFKLRNTTDGGGNSTHSYIYIAFAENPFGGSNVSPVSAR